MQLNEKKWSPLRLDALMLVTGLLLAGCGQSASSAGESVVAVGNTYELVQLEQPQPVDGPFQVVKETAYKLCVSMAKLQNLPVKPFPNAPTDYATQRITVVTDGKSFMRKTEQLYRTDSSTITPDQGCEYRIVQSKAYNITLFSGGKQVNINADEDGKITVDSNDAGDYVAASADAGGTAQFSEPRTVNGIKLRCWPKSHPLLADSPLLDMCVYEKDGVLNELDRRPITLYSKARPVGKDSSYVVITEPVSLRRLTDGVAKRFKVESYTQ